MIENISQNMGLINTVTNFLYSNSDSIVSGLKTISFISIGIGTSFTLYKRRSVSKEKNDNSGESTETTTNNIANSNSSKLENTNSSDEIANNDDSSSISSENLNLVDNTENINLVDGAANNNDGCSKDEFSNIESFDPCNILKSVEYKLCNCDWWIPNKEFAVKKYNNLILDLCSETKASITTDISKFLQDFNIEGAVEYFSNVSGDYSVNVINLINVEGAVEYFSLLRLSQFVGVKGEVVNYGPLPNLFLVVLALTLVRMIKNADLSEELYSMKEKLSLAKINFLSKFSIQDYFRLFKESFLSIIFYSVKGSPYLYCPKYNGVRIIEQVIFNKSNMEFFFAKGKFSQFMNNNSDFCTKRASRAYWLDNNHSIFNVYNDHTVEYSPTRDNHWCDVEESNYGKFYAVDNDLKLNTKLPIDGYVNAKSPYIIFLWRYVMLFRNNIIQRSVAFHKMQLDIQNLENKEKVNKLIMILNGAKDTNRSK